MAQLEELETLITDGSVNKAELYNAVSVKKLFSLMPSEVFNETLKEIKTETTSEEKVKLLKKVLCDFQNFAQNKMLLMLNEKENPSSKEDKFNSVVSSKPKCYYCKQDWISETHSEEYGIFGCPELLRMSNEQRRSEIKR